MSSLSEEQSRQLWNALSTHVISATIDIAAGHTLTESSSGESLAGETKNVKVSQL